MCWSPAHICSSHSHFCWKCHSFNCNSFFSLYYIFILSIHSLPLVIVVLEELLCIILSSKFYTAVGISKCGAHASLPFGRTYVHNFLYVYLHWSPNPKWCLVPVKPSGQHILRRRLELNPSPAYYAVAPHAVVLLQTLPPHSSSVFFKRTREKRICSGGAFKKRICSGDPYPRVP